MEASVLTIKLTEPDNESPRGSRLSLVVPRVAFVQGVIPVRGYNERLST